MQGPSKVPRRDLRMSELPGGSARVRKEWEKMETAVYSLGFRVSGSVRLGK